MRRQAVPEQGLGDLARDVQVGDVRRRQVHRDRDLPVRPPACGRGEGQLEHRLGQRAHEAGLLCRGQQVGRGEQSPGRVLPADEGLDADDPAVAQVDLRLQVDHELAVGAPCAAPPCVRSRSPRPPPAIGTCTCTPSRPGLGGVHRDVGAAQQLLPVAAGTGRGDADADPDVQPDALHVNGPRSGSRSRSASASASSRAASGSRTANSSPPSRASRSPVRRAARSRGPTWRSRSSPAGWPRLSLTSLNPSRSSSRSAAGRRAVAAATIRSAPPAGHGGWAAR